MLTFKVYFMPEDQGILGPINNLGQSLIQGTANAWMEGRRNKMQMAWAEKMYNRQRADAMSDWDRQNAYNSPFSQMERLKAAGLNPNLVYGSGATAMSSQSIRSSQAPAYNAEFSRPQVGTIGMSIDQYFNAQVKQIQIDNLRAQNDLSRFSLYRGQQSLDYDLQAKEANVWKTRNEAELSALMWEIKTEELEIIRETKPQTIQKAVEVLLNMRADRARTEAEEQRIIHAGHLLIQSEQLNEFERKMREDGIMPGTPAWYRALQLFWRDLWNLVR